MDLRAPKAFVGINVSHPSQDVLIEKQRLDVRAPAPDPFPKLLFCCIQRLKAEQTKGGLAAAGGQNGHAAESPGVRVAHFAAIIEREKNVCMRGNAGLRHARYDPAGHAQMNQKKMLSR